MEKEHALPCRDYKEGELCCYHCMLTNTAIEGIHMVPAKGMRDMKCFKDAEEPGDGSNGSR